MDIQKILTLSKKHLSMDTRQKLSHKKRTDWFPFIDVYDKSIYGWFIYINEESFQTSCRCGYMPNDLKALISFTLESGCNILCIDEQVEPLMCLPWYEYRFNVPVTGGNGKTCTVETIWYGSGNMGQHILTKEDAQC
ncbi:MAG: hypothetical protein IJZ68_06030 [Bacteroidaceae bacterium]|nr:hypothetical protein [Bacteroidaceae bacterium]